MYSYTWDIKTGGYLINPRQQTRYVANEIRPVFAEELTLTGLNERFDYDPSTTVPLLWAQKNVYFLNGERMAQLNGTRYGQPLNRQYFFEGKRKLKPVDILRMIAKNTAIMDIMVADAKRRTKELYDKDIGRCDFAYIAFSGGKDSVALLDICHRVLPLSVSVIFSDTDMELPDTYEVWNQIQLRYLDRRFFRANAEQSALHNWETFGPPSRTIRWCCSVHKSTPALILIKEEPQLYSSIAPDHRGKPKIMAFLGVRSEESLSRSNYGDTAMGVKNAAQTNQMPILDWGAHELWLYIFANDLLINPAYRKGIPRVGCVMCPESSEKYEWFVDAAYPGLLKPYEKIIINTSAKNFRTEAEKIDFVGSSGWQARKSGVALRESITNPIEDGSNLVISFQSPHFIQELLFEWVKTVGALAKTSDGTYLLKPPETLGDGIPFEYKHLGGGGIVKFYFRNEAEKQTLLPFIRAMLRKASACVNCRSCEAECTYGAISSLYDKVQIDREKCIQCHKCYKICTGNCWRNNSMRHEVNQNNIFIGLNCYFNFGLRQEWVAVLAEMGNDFFPWKAEGHPLGVKMYPSARTWFAQALLVQEKTHKLLPLVKVFQKDGDASLIGWEFIWVALTNNAPLLKWYACVTNFDMPHSIKGLTDSFSGCFPTIKDSAINCGFSALKDMLTKSPLSGDNAVVSVDMKGKQVQTITRRPKEIHPLTVLYGLYLIAEKAGRSSFTIREMQTADMESVYVSPITAFGIPAETFKRQCQGLASKYPGYIQCTFTYGLDEVKVFPKKTETFGVTTGYDHEDVINLALEE